MRLIIFRENINAELLKCTKSKPILEFIPEAYLKCRCYSVTLRKLSLNLNIVCLSVCASQLVSNVESYKQFSLLIALCVILATVKRKSYFANSLKPCQSYKTHDYGLQ